MVWKSAEKFRPFAQEVLSALFFIFFCENKNEHLKLKLVFDRLDEYALNVKANKSIFDVSNIESLGYNISEHGMNPHEQKVSRNSNFQHPKTVKQIQKFIGMVNYYYRYIPKLAEFTGSTHQIVNIANKSKDKNSLWSKEVFKVFEHIKSCFPPNVLLSHFENKAKLSLTLAASNTAIGGVIQQTYNNEIESLAFFSKRIIYLQMQIEHF